MPYDMTKTLSDRSARLCLLSALALGTACGDDVSNASSDGSTTDPGTTSTTDPTATTNGTSTSTTAADSSTTEAADSSSSSGDPTSTTDPTEGESSTTMVDPTEGTSSSSGGESSSSSTTTTGMMAMDCPYGELMSPDSLTVSTLGQDSEFTNSCGGGGAPDVSYTLVAPADGTYFFTAASPDGVVDPVDPLVAVYDGVCGGAELACNEDIDANTTDARVSVSLTAGQEVTVVVDGFSIDGGDVDLEVAYFEGSCPDGDAGNAVPVTQSGSTVDGDNTTFATCGGTTGNDDQWTFTAPEAGVYTIDTLGSNFDTVLYALDGCGGTELACNDNSVDMTSRINVSLAEGQEIVLVVDGAGLDSGDYDLNIDFDQCPDGDLGTDFPIQVTGNTDFEINNSQGACGPGASNDVAFTFTAPANGAYVFDTNGSDFDTVLYYLDGATCVGPDVECDDDGGDGLDSQLILNMVADQQITMVIDGRNGGSGDYVLNVQAPECGNGIIETGEECDTDEFGAETCMTQGLGGGDLNCTPSCTIDVGGCDTCGNGTVEGDDECDGVSLGSQNCTDLGFDGGALDCAGDCSFDTAQCADGIVVVCSSPGSSIDSANPTTLDTITIPDVGVIADVDLFLDITHTYSGDLDMFLSADDLALTNNLSFDQCSFGNDTFATFNDEGSSAVGADCAEPIAIEGNLTPEQPLSVYDGEASNGDWTLSITDDAGGDVGTLNEWCLYITLE